VITKFPNRPTKDVAIVGAGFSRAISPQFPLTDELGDLAVLAANVARDPRIPSEGFYDGTFELWLSGMAEDQPFLSLEENLENRALFTRVTRGIWTVLTHRQSAALATPAPEWAYDFLSVCHVCMSHVISLNYDNAIECLADGHSLWDFDSSLRADHTDVINNQPPAVETFGYAVARTFRLLKLHGSLNWYWISGDQVGSSIQRWRAPGIFGAPTPDDPEGRHRMLPSRDPFLIPPSSTKSTYNSNPLSRELWSQAFDCLREAQRIFLIGYSLPNGDLTMMNMLGEACQRRDVRIVVANPDPDPVIERLKWIGLSENQMEVFQGAECVDDLVESLRAECAVAFSDRLREWKCDQNLPQVGSLMVTWGQTIETPIWQQFTVTGVSKHDDVIELQLANHIEPVAPEPAQLNQILDLVDDARCVVALMPNSRRLPVIGLWTADQPAGDQYRWISLTVAGRPGPQ